MSRTRRRITLQLIPLLDLLLVVLFAQFMQIQDVSRRQALRTAQMERDATAQMAQVAIDREELARLRDEVAQERLRNSAAVTAVIGEQAQMAQLAAELLQLPPAMVERALASKSPEEIERLKAALVALPDPLATDVVHQLATISELRRTCDVWSIHIDDNNLIRTTFPPLTASFRAETPTEFDRRLFEWYRTLPPSKSVVIIQVTWGDATFGTKYAVREGLVRCTERMRSDRNGRTIFEYVILGFRPST